MRPSPHNCSAISIPQKKIPMRPSTKMHKCRRYSTSQRRRITLGISYLSSESSFPCTLSLSYSSAGTEFLADFLSFKCCVTSCRGPTSQRFAAIILEVLRTLAHHTADLSLDFHHMVILLTELYNFRTSSMPNQTNPERRMAAGGPYGIGLPYHQLPYLNQIRRGDARCSDCASWST